MRGFIVVLLLVCTCLTGRAASLDDVGRPVDPTQLEGREVRFKIDLAGAKDNVKVARLKDGSTVYIVKRLGSDSDRMLTPEEFASLYYTQKTEARPGFETLLNTIFNTTSLAGILWVSVGLAGQAIFMGRMLVQWFASEKSKRSVIPVSFWWMSLIGSTMSLVYFIWRRDIVGILANATGWVVYIRNLMLIHRSRT